MVFITVVAALSIMTPAVAYLWLVKSVHVWELIKTDYIVLDIAISTIIPIIELADYSLAFFFMAPVFCYVAMTRRSLSLIK